MQSSTEPVCLKWDEWCGLIIVVDKNVINYSFILIMSKFLQSRFPTAFILSKFFILFYLCFIFFYLCTSSIIIIAWLVDISTSCSGWYFLHQHLASTVTITACNDVIWSSLWWIFLMSCWSVGLSLGLSFCWMLLP